MNEWSHGYVADEPYTVSYQPGLAPPHLDLVCRLMGVLWEPPRDAAICELGCGRGYTALTLAAAEPRRTVIGIDYNPAHIAEARSIATEAGLENARFLDADLAAMTDAEIDRLPEFDLVLSHGLWTWVADPVREGVMRILSRKVKPGGLVHLSYNSLPGFSRDLVMQRLMRTAAGMMQGSSIARTKDAIDIVRTLYDAKALHLHKTPLAEKLLDTKADLEPAYLAHEFMPEHWRPEFFGDVAAAMGRARLDFVGSATLFENVPELCLDPAQRKVFESFPPGPARELVKDACLTRPFRRDVFMRGVQRADRMQLLAPLVMAQQVEKPEPPKLGVEVGTAELAPEMWEPIRDALSEGPQTLGRLASLPAGRKPNLAELAILLCNTATCLPMVPVHSGSAAAIRFNLAASRRYRGIVGPRLGVAAPGAGSAIACHPLELVLAADVAAFPQDTPEQRADRLSTDRSPERMAEAVETVTRIIGDRLRVWRQFSVVQP
jgi:predicted O-methyltransferase YrrM